MFLNFSIKSFILEGCARKAKRYWRTYGLTNGTADTVSVNSDITGIDFVLQSRPTATVTIQLLDSNGSAPVKYAWFDFFDAEDEYAPIVFPHLGMKLGTT